MMSASIGQIGPPMHPGMPPQQQPPPPPQPSHVQQQIELKYDNVSKVKTLIWSLKNSFANVMKVAGARVNHMAAGKTIEEAPPRFDKTLDDFFSICNQIELHLKAIQECTLQHKDSIQYLPLHVTLGKQDASSGPSQDVNLSYTQYVSTVKAQVNFTKSVQEILSEGVRNVTKSESN
ncbi:mediator of RNA polymerase II transcription subunit 29-like [Argiope bruennichi]|uniref:Mediator of RNA polymerase II transcription subunit 29 n=1 Tax=Argiope bruennichi TaxID=94029 RepID=A0A8T0E4B8_ARGBR|nr:mediator of RNA polymerase II transcription subunit 29-like [Argiope bruennichi]KAF8765087.1 Mediator of RNA polymerase II transcription like protein [Argiope bruennichi]